MPRAESPFRLLPSEQILWQGTPVGGAPRDLPYRLGPLLIGAIAAIAGMFTALLVLANLPGAPQLGLVTAYLSLFALALWLAPRVLHDACEYMITDRRVLARRGKSQRWIDRQGLSFARVIWNHALPGVGHLELVRATPYGPLSRKQRLLLRNLKAPDRLLATLRGAEPVPSLGDPELPLTDRLDADERVLWGGGPQGHLLGVRDVATALLGLTVLGLGLRYGARALSVIVHLERGGLSVGSGTWLLFLLAISLTWLVISCVGGFLLWRGLFRARALGRATEYVVTGARVLIRRGRTELSLDRSAIVDVAVVPSGFGCANVFLILDAPNARALSDSGAMMPLGPTRDLVPPVLYELRDADSVVALLLARSAELDEAA